MKTQERKEHPSTIPWWVRLWTGNHGGCWFNWGFRPLDWWEKVERIVPVFIFAFLLTFAGCFGLFLPRGVASDLLAIATPFFSIVSVAIAFGCVLAWLYCRYRAEEWLRKQWEGLTRIPYERLRTGKVDLREIFGEQYELSKTGSLNLLHFWRVRDLTAWHRVCNPQLRIRDLKKVMQ